MSDKEIKNAIQTPLQKPVKKKKSSVVKVPKAKAVTKSKQVKVPKMAKPKKDFKVPEAERKGYKLLVQQANRTILANLKYIEKNNIKDKHTIRGLVFNYDKKRNWAKNKKGQRAKSPLSRSIQFKSEREYRDYLRHLERMAKSNAKRKERGYKDTVLDRLQRISNIYSVQLPDNKLPDDLKDEIEELTLPQLENWFEIGDPEEDMEVSTYGSDDYVGIEDYEAFRDITLKRLGWLKKAY